MRPRPAAGEAPPGEAPPGAVGGGSSTTEAEGAHQEEKQEEEGDSEEYENEWDHGVRGAKRRAALAEAQRFAKLQMWLAEAKYYVYARRDYDSAVACVRHLLPDPGVPLEAGRDWPPLFRFLFAVKHGHTRTHAERRARALDTSAQLLTDGALSASTSGPLTQSHASWTWRSGTMGARGTSGGGSGGSAGEVVGDDLEHDPSLFPVFTLALDVRGLPGGALVLPVYPLHEAVRSGVASEVAALIRHVGSTTVYERAHWEMDRHWSSPRHKAHVEAVRGVSIRSRGASFLSTLLRERDDVEDTPLRLACSLGFVDIVGLLVEAGADVEVGVPVCLVVLSVP